MNQNSSGPLAPLQESGAVRKGNLDLILLRYMVRRLHVTLCQLDHPDFLPGRHPLVTTLQECRRMHRLAIYQPEALLVQRPLSFVGFISGKQKHLRPCVAQAIQRADQKLVEELADAPGILSYTSLQLQNGNWCNLVLLSDASAKTYLKSSQTHNYAAYHLAHSYYEWIRLHQGVMPEGLDHRGMQLQKTKYYTFPAAQPRPLIRELLYQAPTRVQSIADSALRNDVPANPPL